MLENPKSSQIMSARSSIIHNPLVNQKPLKNNQRHRDHPIHHVVSLISIDRIAIAAYGRPDGVVKPATASSAATSRSDRPGRNSTAFATTSGRNSAYDFRPPHLPVNANETLTDLVIGGATTISLNNSPVILAAAQFQCAGITFISTLTGSVAITFPSTFKKPYWIQNLCSGSSAFVVTLQTTVAGGQAICCPPGETIDCFNDGTNIKFRNLGRVGSYWDYAGSSVPAWVSGCTVPPYLNADGSTFSATTFPVLAVILGSTTLPDSRGSNRYTLNQGTGRLTSSNSGIDGNTNRARGGSDGVTLRSSHIPTITSSGTNSITVASTVAGKPNFPVTAGPISPQPSPSTGGNNVPFSGSGAADWATASQMVGSNSIGVTFTNSSQQNVPATTPGYVGGITMIRAG